jgi:lipopolysaccharide/colanic/teichoic acid biosynthesis glycosyltransferase
MLSNIAPQNKQISRAEFLLARRGLSPSQRLAKRMLDLSVTLFCLFLTLPVMLIVALAIKLDSPGPVLYRQRRVGEGGRLFYMFKFRSLVLNADTLGNRNAVELHDPRVTRVGALLRSIHLDELPQLFNVLLGNISLVGPRPELPATVERYEPWERARLVVPQGFTGWWRVTGHTEKAQPRSTVADLYYVEHYSLWLDIKIMLMTVPAVLQGKSAY